MKGKQRPPYKAILNEGSLREKKQQAVIVLLIAALVLVSAFNIYLISRLPEKGKEGEIAGGGEAGRLPDVTIPDDPLSLEGYEKIEVGVEGMNVFMRSGCKQIAATTTADQAASIEAALTGEVPPRPISHDIVIDALESTGANVTFARIHDMKEGVYYSRLVISFNGTYYALDARPSDAIAVALRANAPVYMERELLESLGEDVC